MTTPSDKAIDQDHQDRLRRLAAMTVLNEMLRKGWVDITAIKSAAGLLQVDPRGGNFSVLESLHCIDFANMPQELRSEIPGLIRDCLDVPPAFRFSAEPETPDVNAASADITPKRTRGALLGRFVAVVAGA